MNEHNTDSVNKSGRPTLNDLQFDATMLCGMIEGISVLHDQAEGPENCPISKRARNSLAPTLDVVIEKAWALTNAIEVMERDQRLGARS